MSLAQFGSSKGPTNFFKSLKSTNVLDALREVTNSDPRSNAQYVDSCEVDSFENYTPVPVPPNFLFLKDESPALFHLIQLLEVTGLRISEALAIRPWDISMKGMINIRSAKSSNNRLVHASSTLQYMLRCKELGVYPFDGLDRFYVYRQFKRLGIGAVYGDNKNKSVTHSFRHEVVLDSLTITEELNSAQQYLGHKSIKSTEQYGKARQ
jgi:integrase